MVSQAFGKSKELRQVTMLLLDFKGNVLGHLYHPPQFLVKALILSELDSIFVLTILNLGRTRNGGGGPSPHKIFLEFC